MPASRQLLKHAPGARQHRVHLRKSKHKHKHIHTHVEKTGAHTPPMERPSAPSRAPEHAAALAHSGVRHARTRSVKPKCQSLHKRQKILVWRPKFEDGLSCHLDKSSSCKAIIAFPNCTGDRFPRRAQISKMYL